MLNTFRTGSTEAPATGLPSSGKRSCFPSKLHGFWKACYCWLPYGVLVPSFAGKVFQFNPTKTGGPVAHGNPPGFSEVWTLRKSTCFSLGSFQLIPWYLVRVAAFSYLFLYHRHISPCKLSLVVCKPPHLQTPYSA